MHLQHDSSPFLPLASCFMTFWFGACAEIKILRWPTSLGHFFPFPFLFLLFFFFAAVIDLLLDLLVAKKLLKKHHQGGQFLPWSSEVKWQEILLWAFHSTFWAFLCISQAPSGRSLWSGNHWKDLFLLQKWSIDDANFEKKWWRQKWKAEAGHGWHGSQWVKKESTKSSSNNWTKTF